MGRMLSVAFLVICLFNAANAWWVTGHALTAEVAHEKISSITQLKINQLLDKKPDVPILAKEKQPKPDLEVLYKSYNYIQGAASWADDIKRYHWKSDSLRANYSAMHYVGVDINLAYQGSKTYCKNTLTPAYMQSFFLVKKSNVVNAIKSAIKSLVLSTTSDAEKATALRYLIHLMGDLHQPLHTVSPKFNSTQTAGGNGIKFTHKAPLYYQVSGRNPFTEIKLYPFSNFHAYFDGVLGKYNQLQETITSSYSPNGFELWQSHKRVYLGYLSMLSRKLNSFRFEDIIFPNVESWAMESSKLACNLLINDRGLYFVVVGKQLNLKFNPHYFTRKYSYKIDRQLYLGGLRLGMLLEAIYNPNPSVRNYQKYLIKPIMHDQSIPTLNQLGES